jgi:Flp pilus assembly protein TadG
VSEAPGKIGLSLLDRFRKDKRGNITMIFAFSVLPVLLAAAVAVDYTRAATMRGRLSAIADAAALVATTPGMMSQPAATAQAAVTSMFAAQAALISGVTYNASMLTANVNDAITGAGTTRTVSVAYAASVTNTFGSFEGLSKTNFTITSAVSATTAPNINFYVLLDASPSMEIPATTTGITALQSATGCALACHETDFKDGELTPYTGWGKMDSYTYAENNGITLRIDNVRQAAQSLVSTAQSVGAANNAAYQMAAYTFTDGVNKILSMQPANSANASAMQAAFSAITPPLMSDNSYAASGAQYTYPTSATNYATVTLNANTLNNDAGTNFGNALKTLNKAMATPGQGTNLSTDTPEGVLLIVTDGVDDVALYNSSTCSTIYGWGFSNTYGNFYRCQQPMDTSLCSTIKARGIRIAILYTTYYPLTSNSWYNSTVAPFISQVPTNLQNCASSPNLFFEVSTDGDITTAMQQLFLNAVATAPHLSK